MKDNLVNYHFDLFGAEVSRKLSSVDDGHFPEDSFCVAIATIDDKPSRRLTDDPVK